MWLACLALVRKGATIGAPAVVLVALFMHLPFVGCEVHSDDLYRYLWEGQVQEAGQNPFALAPDDPRLAPLRGPNHGRITHPSLTTIYPPLAQFVFRAASRAGLDTVSFREWMLLLNLAVVGGVLCWLRSAGRPPAWAILFAWSPLTLAAGVGGHIDPLMLVCLGLAGWSWHRQKLARAGTLLGLAILAKTMAVVLLPWVAIRRPRVALIAVAVAAVGYLPFADAGAGLFSTLLRFGNEFAFNATFYRLFEWMGDAGARIAIAVLFLVWLSFVTIGQSRFAGAVALAFAGLLALSPTVHFWYLGWFLVALPLVGDRRWVWPLAIWCVTVTFAGETYRELGAGAVFREHFALTAAVYLPPLVCAGWLLWSGWPRRESLEHLPDRGDASAAAVVIPAYGEVENLKEILPRWAETALPLVIVADRPTDDGTRELAESIDGVEYLAVEERGYGVAVRAALARLSGESVVRFAVVADADHHLGPQQVESLLAPFADPAVGLVTGARSHSEILSAPQRLGNALTTWLIALGWGRRFHDLGPFRALRLSAWEGIPLEDPAYGWNVEMNVRALEVGMAVVEVPLAASERKHGENRISRTWRGVFGAARGMLHRLYTLHERPS
ncbi:MAG: glycosyltransferase [Planctomycetota bacterium]